MSKIIAWKPTFRYYRELVGIECARISDLNRLIETLWGDNLRTCPHDITVKTVVIPKEAVRFLPLKDIKYKKVELRHTMTLDGKTNSELNRRFLANEEPHFYTTGMGKQRTCCKSLVLLDTLRSIETTAAD